MDEHDIPITKPSTTQENDLFGFGNTDETANVIKDDQKEDLSWVIENNSNSTSPFQSDVAEGDDLTPSVPTATSQADVFGGETLNTETSLPPTATPQSDVFGGETLNTQASLSPTFYDDLFGNQSIDNEPSIILPPTAEDILSDKQPEKPVSVHSEKLSLLHAFNERRQKEIAEKDAEENRKIEELRQEAKKDLERWYKERARQMEQKLQTMKHEEDDLRTASLEKSTKEVCDWGKVIRLLDFSQGSQLTKTKRDISRMRSCIITSKRINDAKKLANGV